MRDGRSLAFTVTGPADGSPVFYCHGAIGTPVDATIDLQRIARQIGVRYIAPSRPGVGGSDPRPGRTVLDFADDVGELADALALERFSVIGVSAGGPYALAVAHQLPDRVRRVALCSALAPFCQPHRTPGLRRRIRLPLAFLAGAPRLVRGLGDAVLPAVARHPELITRVVAAHAAPSERDRLARSDERAAASQSFLDATCAGVGGLIDDFLTYAFGWGFDPREVDSEVQLWHGASDPLVPVEHALQLAAMLPNCRVFIDPDEGHHFFRSGLGEILAALVAPDAVAGLSAGFELRAA
ncbi:MAG TPA: alpha/beta fold hydrolase [Solirubrobacteraceae bacterium]|nr:alpha/beta fold hydrolase [Solirubrobacteraceae bacterium]